MECLRGLQEWDTIKEHAANLDYLDFSKCAAVQRLASNCVKEIKSNCCCPEITPPAWSYVCNGSCDCGDYGSGGGLWCKHHAALICALICKLDSNGFLYLKLLGVDVYELAKADAEAEEKELAPKRQKASGSHDDPICV